MDHRGCRSRGQHLARPRALGQSCAREKTCDSPDQATAARMTPRESGAEVIPAEAEAVGPGPHRIGATKVPVAHGDTLVEGSANSGGDHGESDRLDRTGAEVASRPRAGPGYCEPRFGLAIEGRAASYPERNPLPPGVHAYTPPRWGWPRGARASLESSLGRVIRRFADRGCSPLLWAGGGWT